MLAVVGAPVLQAFDCKVATYVGLYLVASDDGAFQGRVAARLQGDGFSGFDVRIGPHQIVAVGLAFALARRRRDRQTARADAHPDAGAARFVLAAQFRRVGRRQQPDFILGHEGDVLPGNPAALHGQVAACTRAAGNDRHLPARRHRAACGAVGFLGRTALALGTAQTDVQVDAAHLVQGRGVAAVGRVALGVGLGDDLVFFYGAIGQRDRLPLARLHRRIGVVPGQARARRRQRFHPAIVRVARRLTHLLHRLNGADDRVADADRQAALLELLLETAMARFTRFFDGHGFARNRDIALRGQDVAARLPVVLACQQGDMALDTAQRAAQGARAVEFGVLGQFLAAHADAGAAR